VCSCQRHDLAKQRHMHALVADRMVCACWQVELNTASVGQGLKQGSIVLHAFVLADIAS
jgi:ribosomal protein L20